MKCLTVKTPAKLNLFLHVTGKRADGYHELQSLVTFCDIYDEVRIQEAARFSFECVGPFSSLLPDEDNLSVQAAKDIAVLYNIPLSCKITLQKNIPVMAGLGGGSTDAAATVKGLLRFFSLPESEKISELLLSLGADVPVCYHEKSCIMSGIGEKISFMSLPKTHLVLINPGEGCSTKESFKRFSQPYKQLNDFSCQISDVKSLTEVLEETENQLQEVAVALVPAISECLEILKWQEGCELARMSGSGATSFGIFQSYNAAEEAAINIAQNHPEWWVKVCKTL